MPRPIAVTIAATAVMTFGLAGAADARTSRSKVQRAEQAKAIPAPRRTAAAHRNGGWEPFPSTPGLRDRTTIYHPNGRLNGQELFDSIADRTTGAGE